MGASMAAEHTRLRTETLIRAIGERVSDMEKESTTSKSTGALISGIGKIIDAMVEVYLFGPMGPSTMVIGKKT